MRVEKKRVVHKLYAISLFFSASFLFLSCVSTNVYQKTNSQYYHNESVLGEEYSELKNGKSVKKESTTNKTVAMDDMIVRAEIKKSAKSKKETTSIKVYKDEVVIAEDSFDSTGTAETKYDTSSLAVDEKKHIDEKKQLLQNAYFAVKSADEKDAAEKKDTGKIKLVSEEEDVTVKSSPNGKYIVYSFLGKPFVIVGSTAWNLLKCTGYACINFLGGYATVQGNGFLWKMPDVKKSKEKAKVAREKNKIAYYPEYHIPFTDNHITVNKMTTETSNVFSDEKKVDVTSSEKKEYDNSISVKRSAYADANSTASVIGVVGTVITVPVSVVTWVGGVVFGIYDTIAGSN